MNAAAILTQFDEAAEKCVFPMLDNGYVYHADIRMTIYRNSSDWLMVIEALGAYSPRTSGCDSFQNCIHLFGSSLDRSPGTANENFLYPIDSLEENPLFADEYDWCLRPGVNVLGVRGNRVPVDVSHSILASKGIELLDPPAIDPPALLRSLLPEHRDLLFASPEELEARNPMHLPFWLRLDEWNHPDLADGILPSSSETFIMLAKCIEDGDIGGYQPTLQPNTHWSNWPDGGTL